MTTKRRHSGEHYNQDHQDAELGTSSSKRRKSASHSAPRSSNIPPINPLKSKIRDLTRVLEHGDHLPPGVRIEKERALAGYRQELEQAQEEKRKQAIIGKYHMVRFFERQKATRNLKQARKRLQSLTPDTPDHAKAVEDVYVAEIDLNYTLYCPLAEKYEGIFPRERSAHTAQSEHGESGNGEEVEKVLPSRPAMWKVVEQCARDGKLEALRDGKIISGGEIGKRKKPAEKKGHTKEHAKGSGRGVVHDGKRDSVSKSGGDKERADDDESDGGFFEK